MKEHLDEPSAGCGAVDAENSMKVIDTGVTSLTVWVKHRRDPAVEEVTELQPASSPAFIQHRCERG